MITIEKTLEAMGLSKEKVYEEIIRRAMNIEDAASSRLLSEIVARLSPLPRAAMPTININFEDCQTPTDKIAAIANAVADGEVPADIGEIMTRIVEAEIRAKEQCELAERLERIESILTEREK